MVDKVPASELCNELGLQPSLFYQWQRQALENLADGVHLARQLSRAEPPERGDDIRSVDVPGHERSASRSSVVVFKIFRWLNTFLLAVLRVECAVVRLGFSLPAGGSLVVLARKRGPETTS